MRVKLFPRIASYLLDIIPILFTLSLLFSLFVGDMLKPENYDNLMTEYREISDEYTDVIQGYKDQLDAGSLSQDEYDTTVNGLVEDYQDDIEEHTVAQIRYFFDTAMFYIISATLIYFVYSGFTKGRTVGRRIMHIELGGNVNWWTIFMREVIWKTGYWVLTLFVFGVILDIAMISFSKKKQAPRDFITNTRIKYEGVDYPF